MQQSGLVPESRSDPLHDFFDRHWSELAGGVFSFALGNVPRNPLPTLLGKPAANDRHQFLLLVRRQGVGGVKDFSKRWATTHAWKYITTPLVAGTGGAGHLQPMQ